MNSVRKNSVRKNNVSGKPTYRSPAPADYCDEVTDQQMEALRQLVKKEFEDEKPEIVNGPAW